MPCLTRRGLMQAAAMTALLPAARNAQAQAWPERPLRLVVPAPPGAGIQDIMARMIGQHLAVRLGQQVVVDNKPGAGNNVGAEFVAKAPADGYTLLLCTSSLVVADHLYARLGYKPMVDLLPVTQVNSAPLMLVLHPSVKANSVQELIALAKAEPGKLNYGSGGVGSTPYLATELFKSMAGIDAVHVPYKGGAPALADLVGGQLSFMIENVPGTMPFVQDGKLRALAITSAKRSRLAPELPTMAEAGVPGYEMIGWNGVFLPAGTPFRIVNKLAGDLIAIIGTPEVKAQFAKLGAEPVGSQPDDFAQFMKAEAARWGKIITERGIKPE
jgi:tripartite-type tricarboxylate transporter receptor subunit TctC